MSDDNCTTNPSSSTPKTLQMSPDNTGEYYPGEWLGLIQALEFEGARLWHLTNIMDLALDSRDLEQMRAAWREIANYIGGYMTTRTPGKRAGTK